jgi:hypothetical protein
MAAGLVHAGFEDWLFAVGYYLCVFFWTLAFMFVDVLPHPTGAHQPRVVPLVSSWPSPVGVAGGR